METHRAALRLVSAGTPGESGPSVVVTPDLLPAKPARLDAVRLLSLDAHGRVLDWMSWQDATCLYVRGAVAWTLGDPCLSVHGGTCRASGAQSVLELHPIVAARGHARPRALDPTPALTNVALFARDQHLCLYCGRDCSRQHLTRDHVVPAVEGRPRHLGKRRRRLLPLQFAQGRPHAAAGVDAAARGAVPAELDRAPDPVQPQHPGRPDGVPEKPPAEATAA